MRRSAAVLISMAMGCSLDRASEAASGGAGAGDPSGSGSGNAGQSGVASSSAGAGSSASSVASGAAASSGGGGSAGAGSGGDSSGPGGMGSGGAPPLACWGPGAVCCGGVACAIGTHECCFPDQTQAESGSCVVLGTCPRPEVSVTCDDTEDCAGGACCTTWTGSQHVGMQCTSVAGCTPPVTLGAPGNYPMCNYPGGTCPAGMNCYQDCCVGDAGWGYCY